MTGLQIALEGDGCWPELVDFDHGDFEGVALIPDGDVTDGITGESKKVPIVLCRVRSRATGRVALAQLKLETLELAVRALRGRMSYLAAQAASAKGKEA